MRAGWHPALGILAGLISSRETVLQVYRPVGSFSAVCSLDLASRPEWVWGVWGAYLSKLRSSNTTRSGALSLAERGVTLERSHRHDSFTSQFASPLARGSTSARNTQQYRLNAVANIDELTSVARVLGSTHPTILRGIEGWRSGYDLGDSRRDAKRIRVTLEKLADVAIGPSDQDSPTTDATPKPSGEINTTARASATEH